LPGERGKKERKKKEKKERRKTRRDKGGGKYRCAKSVSVAFVHSDDKYRESEKFRGLK